MLVDFTNCFIRLARTALCSSRERQNWAALRRNAVLAVASGSLALWDVR